MSILRTILAICALALALPASAEEETTPSGTRTEAEGEKSLGQLFKALAGAESPAEADLIELAVLARLSHTDSPSEALILRQATALFKEGDLEPSRKKLDVLIEVAPDYTEGWNSRAIIHREQGNYAAAVSDLQRVLVIEPRHFIALTLLGVIFEEMGQPKSALKAWEAALEIHPHLEGGKETIRKLTNEVKGRGI
ncbi:MAG: tetratricopeptide repeat protein [bacterium]